MGSPEREGAVGSTPDSYSGGRGFESHSRHGVRLRVSRHITRSPLENDVSEVGDTPSVTGDFTHPLLVEGGDGVAGHLSTHPDATTTTVGRMIDRENE